MSRICLSLGNWVKCPQAERGGAFENSWQSHGVQHISGRTSTTVQSQHTGPRASKARRVRMRLRWPGRPYQRISASLCRSQCRFLSRLEWCDPSIQGSESSLLAVWIRPWEGGDHRQDGQLGINCASFTESNGNTSAVVPPYLWLCFLQFLFPWFQVLWPTLRILNTKF